MDTEYELGEGRKRVMVFPIGQWKTGKYAKLDLTREFANHIVDNFHNKVLGATEPFIDSSGKHDEATPAAAWVKGLEVAPWKQGEALWADVDWTPVGDKLVQEKQYRYLSALIAPHVIPETGEKVYPVLRSMTLTNRPVLRMMPEVSASEQAELADIALSELTPVEEVDNATEVQMGDMNPTEPTEIQPPEPEAAEAPEEETVEETVESIVDSIMSSVGKLDAKIRYKRGAPALRGQFKDAINAYVTRIAASEGDEPSDDAGKEMNRMQKLVEYFKLSEDADEDAIVAAHEAQVTELTEARDTALAEKVAIEATLTETVQKLSEAEGKLAEQEKAAHEAEMEHRFSEAIKDGTILPADIGDEENPGWLRKLAETSDELFTQYLESRKSPAVDLSEQGSGSNEEQPAPEEKLRADARLAKKARELKSEHPELTLAECQNKALAEDAELLAEYRELKQAQLSNRG